MYTVVHFFFVLLNETVNPKDPNETITVGQ